MITGLFTCLVSRRPRFLPWHHLSEYKYWVRAQQMQDLCMKAGEYLSDSTARNQLPRTCFHQNDQFFLYCTKSLHLSVCQGIKNHRHSIPIAFSIDILFPLSPAHSIPTASSTFYPIASIWLKWMERRNTEIFVKRRQHKIVDLKSRTLNLRCIPR